MQKDWKASSKTSSLITLGAKHKDRLVPREEHDFYATDPKAVRLLLELEHFEGVIWECACGEGHLSKEMERLGYEVISSDLIDRGFGKQYDFLSEKPLKISINSDGVNIVTNPPFRYAQEFVEKALSIVPHGKKVAMFLRIQFLETKKRAALFKKYPCKKIYVAASRIECAINAEFTGKPTAACYAWFVWEKGYTGEMTIQPFNT